MKIREVKEQHGVKHEEITENIIKIFYKEVGLLLNYGIKSEIKRKIYDNELKKYGSV